MIFSCVLRKSLAFGPEHVEWLGRQVERFYPECEFRPFSDVPLGIPHEILRDNLPTWWSKMEAYARLQALAPVTMLDLDTVITRRLELPVPEEDFAYMQASPRHVEKVWGGFQISSPRFRRTVVEHFYKDPEAAMAACNGCDQKYYTAHHRSKIKILNALIPDAIVSYKMHVLQQGLQPANAFIMFHALPRPWHCQESWIPRLLPPSE